MNLAVVRYNERSWAIDLIGHLKQLTLTRHRVVRDAGGEQTIQADGNSLFPDVLLFGDRATARIIQGWELKMPDTSIDDYEFRRNAEQKARVLGLDSYVLWNVSYAHLYALDKKTDNYVRIQNWDNLSDITSRADVQRQRSRWEHLAETILDRVNELLEEGKLEGRQFIEAYKSGGLTQLILANTGLVSEALQAASAHNVRLKSEITMWWQRYQVEYDVELPHNALAQANLINWIGKLLFAHILRERDSRARAIGQIGEKTTPAQALTLFEALSRDCNFWTIFSDSIGLSILPDIPWSQLRQFNSLLSDLRVGSVDQEQLSGLLEATASVGSRKLRGQYTTPPELSKLLVQLCVQDVDGRILDPCCGSGTISRAALEYKLSNNINPQAAAASVFASDLDPQAVQLATFAMAKPVLMSQPLRLFKQDAFTLTPDVEVEFRHPNDGSLFRERLGIFHAITSNLPFVAQGGRKAYIDAISRVNQLFNNGPLPGRADIAAYLPFTLHKMLEPGGRMGIIITNAWLGTDWGDTFAQYLIRFYKIKAVITSGAGRWFQNSKIVTNIIVLEKLINGHAIDNENIKFVVLKRPLGELADAETLAATAAQIELGQSQDDTMIIRSVTPENLRKFRTLGLAGNAQFADINWVLGLPLIPVKSLFEIRRGERRGWDPLFYPAAGHGIEKKYIRPVILNSKAIEHYTTRANEEAFSCSVPIAKLKSTGDRGALAWINKYAEVKNETGIPLVKCLARSGMNWYEMKANTLANLVMPINYGERIYIARVDPPAFVNQRLIGFNSREGVDLDLCHALLNSTISLFMIEGIGFGRGQGALDLNKDRMEKYMHMLDPMRLNERDQAAIKRAFDPLKRREIFVVADELEQNDRQKLDDIILSAYGLDVSRDRIYDSLLNLVSIRLTANT